jgi:hypothetical protein
MLVTRTPLEGLQQGVDGRMRRKWTVTVSLILVMVACLMFISNVTTNAASSSHIASGTCHIYWQLIIYPIEQTNIGERDWNWSEPPFVDNGLYKRVSAGVIVDGTITPFTFVALTSAWEVQNGQMVGYTDDFDPGFSLIGPHDIPYGGSNDDKVFLDGSVATTAVNGYGFSASVVEGLVGGCGWQNQWGMWQ